MEDIVNQDILGNNKNDDRHISLSVIIPAYNEQSRLKTTFKAVDDFLLSNNYLQVEIIFVDDGSKDKTKELINNYISKFKGDIKLISYLNNRGKGYAVRQGMLASKGDYCLMIDADMSTTFDELRKASSLIQQNVPIIIGTRKDKGAVLLKKQPWYRQKMGDIYAIIARAITGVNVKDFGCGFKLFSSKAAKEIFSKSFIDGWIFDTEVLYLAKKLNYQVQEVGVNWKNDEDTRVNAFSDALKSIVDLIKIYFGHHNLSKHDLFEHLFSKKIFVVVILSAVSIIYYLPYLLHPQVSLLDDPWYVAHAQNLSIFDWSGFLTAHNSRLIPFTLFFYTSLYKLANYGINGFIWLRLLELFFILFLSFSIIKLFASRSKAILGSIFICLLSPIATNFFELETQDHISLLLLLLFSLLYLKIIKGKLSKFVVSFFYFLSLIILLFAFLTKETNLFILPMFALLVFLNFFQRDSFKIKKINIGYFCFSLLWFVFFVCFSSQIGSVASEYSIRNIPVSLFGYFKILNLNLIVIFYVIINFLKKLGRNNWKLTSDNYHKLFLILLALLSLVVYLPWGSAGDRYMLVPLVFIYILFFSEIEIYKNKKLTLVIVILALLSNIFFSTFHFVRFFGSRMADGQLLSYLVEHKQDYDQVCMQLSPQSPENLLELNIWLNQVKKLNKKICTLVKIDGFYNSTLTDILDKEGITYGDKVLITKNTWVVVEGGSVVYGSPIDSQYEFAPFYDISYSIRNIHPIRGFEVKRFVWIIGKVTLGGKLK